MNAPTLIAEPPALNRARGEARIAVRASARGTELARLRQSGSAKAMTPRRSGEDLVAVLVNTAGGVTGGDRFHYSGEAEAGAALTLSTQAAERAYRARDGEVGRVSVALKAAEGARIDWLPQETILFINEFLTPLTDVVLRNSGTIDKYMGDCIMAFWNAPRKSDLHMEQATLALFQFHEALKEINRNFVKLGFPEIDIGVGVNTGPCAVGAMGSKSRLDYSCIGDAVNLSSRLEGITKQYGLWNCIGDTTAQGVRHTFALIEIDQVAVKGRSLPERIWTVAGAADIMNGPDYIAIRDAVKEGIEAYKAQDRDKAERSEERR